MLLYRAGAKNGYYHLWSTQPIKLGLFAGKPSPVVLWLIDLRSAGSKTRRFFATKISINGFVNGYLGKLLLEKLDTPQKIFLIQFGLRAVQWNREIDPPLDHSIDGSYMVGKILLRHFLSLLLPDSLNRNIRKQKSRPACRESALCYRVENSLPHYHKLLGFSVHLLTTRVRGCESAEVNAARISSCVPLDNVVALFNWTADQPSDFSSDYVIDDQRCVCIDGKLESYLGGGIEWIRVILFQSITCDCCCRLPS